MYRAAASRTPPTALAIWLAMSFTGLATLMSIYLDKKTRKLPNASISDYAWMPSISSTTQTLASRLAALHPRSSVKSLRLALRRAMAALHVSFRSAPKSLSRDHTRLPGALLLSFGEAHPLFLGLQSSRSKKSESADCSLTTGIQWEPFWPVSRRQGTNVVVGPLLPGRFP